MASQVLPIRFVWFLISMPWLSYHEGSNCLEPTGCFLSEMHIKHTPRLISSIPICEQWAFLFNTREMESRQHYPVYHARIKEQLLPKPLCRYSVCSLHTGNGQKDHFTNVDVFLVRLGKAFLCYCRGVNKKVGIRCMCLFK